MCVCVYVVVQCSGWLLVAANHFTGEKRCRKIVVSFSCLLASLVVKRKSAPPNTFLLRLPHCDWCHETTTSCIFPPNVFKSRSTTGTTRCATAGVTKNCEFRFLKKYDHQLYLSPECLQVTKYHRYHALRDRWCHKLRIPILEKVRPQQQK